MTGDVGSRYDEKFYESKFLPDKLRAAPGLPGAAGESPSGDFQSAADVSAGVHRTVSRLTRENPERISNGPVGSAKKKALLDAIRTTEQAQLRKWANFLGLSPIERQNP